MHAALYISSSFKLNPAISTLPVTGRIRKAYQSILQLAALTGFLDQTFSTVVRFATHTDIEMDDSPISANCLNMPCLYITRSGVRLLTNMTLWPCTKPYNIWLSLSSSALGGELAINGIFSQSTDVLRPNGMCWSLLCSRS